MELTLDQIAYWTGGELHLPGEDPGGGPVRGYSIDSRTLQPGELFFAVRGEKYDAHDFVPVAFDRGARAVVISRGKAGRVIPAASNRAFLLVDDPLQALQQLAAAVRRLWNKRLIGITGSAGKTTTKEAVAKVLEARFQVLKSHGNLNNAFGLPLQLLQLEPAHDCAVIEMGMSHAGELTALAGIASPDWGVVTNVGTAHAGNFADGIAGVARAKYELVQALPRHGVAFLNCDDPYVSQFGRDFRGKTIYFGSGPCANPRSMEIHDLGREGASFEVLWSGKRIPASVRLMGKHNVQNAMAAIAVGLEAGLGLEECVEAIDQLTPSQKRGEILSVRGATIINDCYNSNPEALRSMIASLAAMPAKRRILVAGEMLELGAGSPGLHRECGEFAARSGIDIILGVQGDARYTVEGAREAGGLALFLSSAPDAGLWLQQGVQDGDAVLLKASRGVGLERALSWIES